MGVMTFNPRRQTGAYHCNLQNSPKTSFIFDRIILVINRLQQPVRHMNKCLWIIFCKHGSKVSDTRLLYRLTQQHLQIQGRHSLPNCIFRIIHENRLPGNRFNR